MSCTVAKLGFQMRRTAPGRPFYPVAANMARGRSPLRIRNFEMGWSISTVTLFFESITLWIAFSEPPAVPAQKMTVSVVGPLYSGISGAIYVTYRLVNCVNFFT